jgi:hypothetical protein
MAGAPANKTGLDTLNAILPNDAQTGANWNGQKLAQIYSPEQIDALTNLKTQGNQFQTASNTIGGVPVKNTPGVTPSDLGWLGYDAARGPHGLPLLVSNAFNMAGKLVPGTAAKNEALAKALAVQGAEGDSVAQTIAGLLARRAAGGAAGTTLAPIFAGVGLGAFDR